MIIKILIGLAVLIVILLIVVALQPNDFRVERSATLAATPAVLFDNVNDHHKFNVWNPWLELDPAAKNTYSGPDSGVGAKCSWEGKETGAGSSTIIESKPGELVRFKMDWIKPMQGTSTVDFIFKPAGDKTTVTWAMYGRNNFMAKAASLVMDCEKMCGPQFEKGLAKLGAVTAANPGQSASLNLKEQ
ncbi:MAG: SRPBCC family protein [Armatimonadetes bacterium]|nr:SRPBCC family protein [Akkermansiaceae bacterium]